MLINVFGSTVKANNKIKTFSFIQIPYLRANYVESDIEKDIDMKNQTKIKSLSTPIDRHQATPKSYVDDKFNDPSIIRNTAHVDFNDKSFDNVRFAELNSLPALREHLTPKFYVHEAVSKSVDESSLLRLDPDEELKVDQQVDHQHNGLSSV